MKPFGGNVRMCFNVAAASRVDFGALYFPDKKFGDSCVTYIGCVVSNH